MTLQEIFDKVVQHARTQGYRATNSRGMCQYRYGGRKCFIGALIPDEDYEEAMEVSAVDALIGSYHAIAILLGSDKIEALLELQTIHDVHSVEEWEQEFEEFAAKHSLEYAKPV